MKDEKPGTGCPTSRVFETWASTYKAQIGKSLLPVSPPNRQKPFADQVSLGTHAIRLLP